MSFCFFFESHGDLRYLHSFPTRRSSDLVSHHSTSKPSYCKFPCINRPMALSSSMSRIRLFMRVAPPRSEEHTSELQSLRHLVCRLLLEKKKNKTSTTDSCTMSSPAYSAA